MNEQLVTIEQFNGLGERVNILSEKCSACKADKEARFENVAERQDSQNGDIQKLYEKLDELKTVVSKYAGIFIGAVFVFNVGLVILMKFWK